MANSAVIWTFAGVIAAACAARGLSMASNAFWMFFWYALGAAVLAGASVIWVSLEPTMLIQHRIVVGSLGALLGCFALLSAGELINPTDAQPGPQSSTTPPISPPANPPSSPIVPTGPPVTIQGNGPVIFNYGSAGSITQNTESKAREAIRDPDGIYQFDQKVATIIAAEVDRSKSQVSFKEIRNANNLNIDRDFQYREYVLHFANAGASQTSSGALFGNNKAYMFVTCVIVGIIN
jgi:hypothetical protein